MRESVAEAAGYRIQTATGADHGAVARELAAYLAFLGETLDGEGLDRDIAQWQSAYDGDTGVLLVVVEPGARWWEPRRCAASSPGSARSSACGYAPRIRARGSAAR